MIVKWKKNAELVFVNKKSSGKLLKKDFSFGIFFIIF